MKTHNLRAFTHAIPKGSRLVTIEDMPELIGLPHANVVHLFYSKGGQSVAKVTAEGPGRGRTAHGHGRAAEPGTA